MRIWKLGELSYKNGKNDRIEGSEFLVVAAHLGNMKSRLVY